MAKVIVFLLVVAAHLGYSAEVKWNCFQLRELEDAAGVGCYYDAGYSSPEIGLRYYYMGTGSRLAKIDGMGAANVGWNIAIWILAEEGALLCHDYFSEPHVVLKDSYNDAVQNPIQLNPIGNDLSIDAGESFYLGVIGNYYDDGGVPNDYYAWIQLESDGTDLQILGSAFSYEQLAVGFCPIPEPTSGLLFLLGVAGLALRRKQK